MSTPARTQPVAPALRSKGWSRDSKARIIDAATALFATQGYTATTIEQIGAAVGLTGPAIYRHFTGKADLFEAVMYYARLPAWEETRRVTMADGDARETLRQVVAAWVEQSVDRRALIAAYAQQHRFLSDAIRQRFRAQYRELTDVWVDLLGRVHPQLSVAERTTMVDSAMWLLRSPAFYRSELPAERVTELLTTMIMGSLMVEPATAPARGRRRRSP